MPISNQKIESALAECRTKFEAGAPIKTYRVVCEIDIDGVDEAHAALQALSYLRDPQSTATIFEVKSAWGSQSQTVDLASDEENCEGEVASLEDLKAFALSVAQLHKLGETDVANEPFEPPLGDSQSCLMDLIDDAREVCGMPHPPNLQQLFDASNEIAEGDVDRALQLLATQTRLRPDFQKKIDDVISALKERSASSVVDADLRLKRELKLVALDGRT